MARKNSLETITNLVGSEISENKRQSFEAAERYDYVEALRLQTVNNTLIKIVNMINACKPKGKPE